MPRVITAVDPKPGRTHSEDVVGYANDFYWLLDGATPPSLPGSSALTQRFLTSITGHLERLARVCPSYAPEQLLADAIAGVREDFADIAPDGFFPHSTAVVVKLVDRCLQYCVLGDSYLIVDDGTSARVICDDRLKHIATSKRAAVRRLRAEGIGEDEPAYRQARDALIAEEKSQLNRPGGFWVAARDPDAPSHGLVGKVELPPDAMALAASDGYARLATMFSEPDALGALPKATLHLGAVASLNRLRHLESTKTSHASSKHDDAAFLLLHQIP